MDNYTDFDDTVRDNGAYEEDHGDAGPERFGEPQEIRDTQEPEDNSGTQHSGQQPEPQPRQNGNPQREERQVTRSRGNYQKGQNGNSNLKEVASNASIIAYGYVADLKGNGHTSIGDLIFRETMRMTVAASLASESIGRDRFLEHLESGFYASGRLLVYLDFTGTIPVSGNTRETLIDSVTAAHKIFAASVKTVKNKPLKQQPASVV